MFAGNQGVVVVWELANVQAKYATTAKKAPKMIDNVLGLIKFAIRVHQSYFGIGYTSSPPSHF